MALSALRAFFVFSTLVGAAATSCSGRETASHMVRDVSLVGRTFVITGGDTGLGYETALALASARGTIILACRSKTKCPAAAAKISQTTGNKNVSVVPMDLSSFDSVRKCAATIRKQTFRIDALINNAGILENPKGLPKQTEDGFDRVYQVNFLSNFLFTQELLPVLRQSHGRVVNVASVASEYACAFGNYFPGCTRLPELHKIAKMSPHGISKTWGPASNYGVTKYLDVFSIAELARREPNVTAVSLHPGIVKTDMYGLISPLIVPMWCLASDAQLPCPRSPAQGASTQTYLAVAPTRELADGKYYASCKQHHSVRDGYARWHGEKGTVTYQAGVYDMAASMIKSRAVTKSVEEAQSAVLV